MGLDTLHQHLGHCTLNMYLSVSNCICLCFNLYLCVWCTLAGLGSDTPHQSVEHNGAQFRPQSPNCIWPRTDLTGSAHQVGGAHATQITLCRCTQTMYTCIYTTRRPSTLSRKCSGSGSIFRKHQWPRIHYKIHKIEVHIIQNVLSLHLHNCKWLWAIQTGSYPVQTHCHIHEKEVSSMHLKYLESDKMRGKVEESLMATFNEP